MAFAKKQRLEHHDSRPQGTKIVMREGKVKALRADATPEARKQLKQMNVIKYRGARTNLHDWWAPKSKCTAKP